MSHCVTCKAWLGPREDSRGRTVGNCSLVQRDHESALDLQGKPSRAYIHGEPGDSSWARVATDPYFGCVQWEAK
jgi:hypothetical protein